MWARPRSSLGNNHNPPQAGFSLSLLLLLALRSQPSSKCLNRTMPLPFPHSNLTLHQAGFSLSLLLSLARLRRFEEPTISCIVGLIKAEMGLRARCATSPWMAGAHIFHSKELSPSYTPNHFQQQIHNPTNTHTHTNTH